MRIDLGLGLGSAVTRRRTGGPAGSLGPYLPTLAAAALAAWGARRMVEGYGGSLYRLRRASDNAALDVAAAGSDLPDYAAINSWAGGAGLSVATVYDQTGGGRHLGQATAARQPLFDPALALAGCSPFSFAGVRQGTAYHYMSAAVSANRQNASVWMVFQPLFSSNVQLYWQLLAGGSQILNCFTQSDRLQLYDGSFKAFGADRVPRAMPSVIGFNCDANLVATVRETTESLANAAAAATDSFNIGSDGAFGGNYNSQFNLWGGCVYPDLSTGDQLSLRQALEAIYAIPTTFTSRIVFGGDSIMEGTGSTFLRNMPNQLSGLPGTPEIFNCGIYGQLAASENGSYANRIGPLFTSAYGAGKCLFVTEAGTNEIGGGYTPAQLETTVGSLVATAKASGFKVGISTLTPTAVYGNSADRDAYNSWVMAGSSGADFAVDAATAPNMNDSGNTTYYADGLHPTSAGYAALASRYGAAIAAALI